MTILPLLNSAKEVFIDDEDYTRCTSYSNWSTRKTPTGLVIEATKRPHISLASFILENDCITDHKDRDPFNNQKANLRVATHSQNMMNRAKINPLATTSKYKGVYWNKEINQWHCRISINGARKHLGFFYSEETAAKKYNEAALKYHKDFAVLNVLQQEVVFCP